MDIKHLLKDNEALAVKAGEIRARRSWLSRILKNWLHNGDGEAECHAQMLGNQNQMIDILNSELSKRTYGAADQAAVDSRLFSDLYVVHSLPKVGGMSIAATLIANFKNATVVHVHCLTDKWLRKWRMALSKYSQPGREAVMQHLYYARKAAMMLEASTLMCPNTHGRAIICGVREPIAWALSLYFEGFSYLMGDNYESITVEKVADFVIKVLGNEMCDLGPSYLSPERWLTDEFSPAHNFNPLGHDFDIGTGYRVYETGKTPILMIRQESLSSLPQALSLLLSHPAEFISPVNENIAEAKVYSGIYRTIRDRLKFDSAFLHSVYSGAYSRKFYSEAECESFKRRWKS